jgi:DNA-binding response OmpR family regulator
VSDATGKGLVLVVEDERAIAELVRLYLTRDGFGVHVEGDGEGALAAARRLRPVAWVLDIGLPGMDGTDVCRRLRESGDWTPVIFLTARDDEVDRVVGLELGADDYVTKPFSPRELVARIKAVLRRAGGGPATSEAPRSVGAVTLDPGRRRVWAGGSEVVLTSTEFDLLAHTVDVHVAQVRAKLGEASVLARDLIRTVRGVGYTADGDSR